MHVVTATWYLGQLLPPTPRSTAGCTTKHHRKLLLPVVIRLHNSTQSVRQSQQTSLVPPLSVHINYVQLSS